jgi:predicted SAM-dependent methyltransferase
MTPKQRIGQWIYQVQPFSRRTFNILRFEFRICRQRWVNLVWPHRRYKIARLRSMRGISLNVGSGGKGLEGWINLDASSFNPDLYATHDLRRPLPLADGSVKRILAEHVIEHLDPQDDIPGVFREFHRVLEKDGAVRIIVPDVARFLKAYLSRDPADWRALGFSDGRIPGAMSTPMEMINHVFHQGGEHCAGWDYPMLEHALLGAGFSRVLRQEFGISVDPELAIDLPNHAAYSLYVEAVK